MKYCLPILSFLVFIGLSSCQKESISINDNTIIKAGTSFGFCVGYCSDVLEISDDLAHFDVISNDQNLSSRNCEKNLTELQWNELKLAIDLENIEALPDVIGCPDCVDQGSEWIEIHYQNKVKRITFEFGESIPEIDNLLRLVRQIREGFNQCN